MKQYKLQTKENKICGKSENLVQKLLIYHDNHLQKRTKRCLVVYLFQYKNYFQLLNKLILEINNSAQKISELENCANKTERLLNETHLLSLNLATETELARDNAARLLSTIINTDVKHYETVVNDVCFFTYYFKKKLKQ